MLKSQHQIIHQWKPDSVVGVELLSARTSPFGIYKHMHLQARYLVTTINTKFLHVFCFTCIPCIIVQDDSMPQRYLASCKAVPTQLRTCRSFWGGGGVLASLDADSCGFPFSLVIVILGLPHSRDHREISTRFFCFVLFSLGSWVLSRHAHINGILGTWPPVI